ncbi:hypothetical protein MPTK2_7g07540 [Marchantia polymorpha subsp. ruderalis]
MRGNGLGVAFGQQAVARRAALAIGQVELGDGLVRVLALVGKPLRKKVVEAIHKI